MTRAQLYARAVAFDATGENRFVDDLPHADREYVLGTVAALRAKRDRETERSRLKREWELDQAGPPQVLP